MPVCIAKPAYFKTILGIKNRVLPVDLKITYEIWQLASKGSNCSGKNHRLKRGTKLGIKAASSSKVSDERAWCAYHYS